MNRSLLGVTLLVALLGCSNRASRDVEGTATPPAAAATMTAAHAGPSLYPLRVALEDQGGRAIGLDVFRGHPTIVSMFYGSCPVACPMIISRIKSIEAQLPESARHDVRILLVSFDGAHDSPEVLAGIAKARELDTSRWSLARGSDDDVRQIAAVLGVSYRALPSGAFEHDSVITVLDRDGRTMVRDDDPYADLAPMRNAVTAVASSR